jgi:YD repeat-containing protein
VSNPRRPSDTATCQGQGLSLTTTNHDFLSRISSVQTTCDSARASYFYQNNQTVVTDPASISKWSQVDGLGRLTYVIEGQSSFLTTAPSLSTPYPTSYTYSAVDNLTNVHQNGSLASGETALSDRQFSYDWLNRLTSSYNPESGATLYTLYDNDNNLITKTDANTVQTTFGYNEIDLLKSKTYSSGKTVTYSYSDMPGSVGRLTSVSTTNDGGSSVWSIQSYDALGRPTASSQRGIAATKH